MNWDTSAPNAAGTSPIVVNVPSHRALLEDIRQRISAGEGFQVATLNLDHVVKIRRDPAFRDAYRQHSHVTADGNPIVWLSRLAGQRVSLTTGSDLVEPLCALAAETDVPLGFFGTTQETLDRAAETLRLRHPGLRVVARIAPPMGFDPEGSEADAALAELEAAGARLCLLALGAPKQERFAARAAHALPHAGFVSIGAGLDFIAGSQIRAPHIFRALALEWAWRLLRSPFRLAGRYAACLGLLPQLTVSALRARTANRRARHKGRA